MDSVYFPPEKLGEVRIDSFEGRVVTFTRAPTLIGPLSPKDDEEIKEKIAKYVAYNGTMTPYTVGKKSYALAVGYGWLAAYDVKLLIGANQYQFIEELDYNEYPAIQEFPDLITHELVTLRDNTAEMILGLHEGSVIRPILMSALTNVLTAEYNSLPVLSTSRNNTELNTAADALSSRIVETMHWYYEGTDYYDTPTHIRERVLAQVGTTAEMYIPVVTVHREYGIRLD
jgi:hypothetical protein